MPSGDQHISTEVLKEIGRQVLLCPCGPWQGSGVVHAAIAYQLVYAPSTDPTLASANAVGVAICRWLCAGQ